MIGKMLQMSLKISDFADSSQSLCRGKRKFDDYWRNLFLFCLVDLYAVVDDDGYDQGDDAEDGPRLRTGEDQQRHGDGQRQQQHDQRNDACHTDEQFVLPWGFYFDGNVDGVGKVGCC